jgi:hypothetical protein
VECRVKSRAESISLLSHFRGFFVPREFSLTVSSQCSYPLELQQDC